MPPITSSHPLFGLTLRLEIASSKGKFSRIAWGPNGADLAASVTDKTIRIWDVPRRSIVRVLASKPNRAFSLAWSPDGRTLASGVDDKTVQLWHARTGRRGRTFSVGSWVSGVAWSPDARVLACTAYDGTIRFWSPTTGKLLLKIKTDARLRTLAASPSGSFFAAGGPGSTVIIFQVYWAGSSLSARQTQVSESTSTVSEVTWSPDGTHVASAGEDGTIRIVDAFRSRVVKALEGNCGELRSISFCFDQTLLAAKGCDNSLHVWRCDTWRSVAVAEELGRKLDSGGCITFHPREYTLAEVAHGNTGIRIWDVNPHVLLKR